MLYFATHISEYPSLIFALLSTGNTVPLNLTTKHKKKKKHIEFLFIKSPFCASGSSSFFPKRKLKFQMRITHVLLIATTNPKQEMRRRKKIKKTIKEIHIHQKQWTIPEGNKIKQKEREKKQSKMAVRSLLLISPRFAVTERKVREERIHTNYSTFMRRINAVISSPLEWFCLTIHSEWRNDEVKKCFMERKK